MNSDMTKEEILFQQKKEMEPLITQIHNVLNEFDKLKKGSDSTKDNTLSHLPMDEISEKIENLLNLYTIKEEIDPLKKRIQFILNEFDKIIQSNDDDDMVKENKIKYLYPELKKMQKGINEIY